MFLRTTDSIIFWGTVFEGTLLAANILATDLDGTLIPLVGVPHNQRALHVLNDAQKKRSLALTFVTGRHLESVRSAIQEHQLPLPDWIICDVGTSIFRCARGRGTEISCHPVPEYRNHLDGIAAQFPVANLRDRLSDVAGVRLQEPRKQSRFKLSYYTERSLLQTSVELIAQRLDQYQAPYSIVHSVDPFSGEGLIDLLPRNVSKAHALNWWCQRESVSAESLVYAGDSGNDLAALVAGYRSIVVGNADRELADTVTAAHRSAGWTGRLFLANEPGTSGVLEGCRHFGLLSELT